MAVTAAPQKAAVPQLKDFAKDGHPKALIETLAENLLASFRAATLLRVSHPVKLPLGRQSNARTLFHIVKSSDLAVSCVHDCWQTQTCLK